LAIGYVSTNIKKGAIQNHKYLYKLLQSKTALLFIWPAAQLPLAGTLSIPWNVVLANIRRPTGVERMYRYAKLPQTIAATTAFQGAELIPCQTLFQSFDTDFFHFLVFNCFKIA
jgi:hypothetical protein